MRLFLIAMLSSAVIFMSCGNDSKDSTTSSEEKADTTETSTELSIIKNGIELAPFPNSPSYDNAIIQNLQYENGTFRYTIPEGEFKLGEQTSDADLKMCANSAEGQHIHLIIDTQPYFAYYTAEFDKDIEDGSHYILTFLSRSYHESIKTKEAHRAIKVKVENGEFTSVSPIKEEMLFYSRPKGTYIGDDTENVMLDFYPVNVTLGEDAYAVQVDINDNTTFTVHEWKPYYLKGLPMGENKITLTLLDNEGNIVDTPLNPVSRTITLKEDPAKL